MSVLRIFLFNQVRVVHRDCATEPAITPTSQTLLAYLLLNQSQYHCRERLADTLWEGYSQERARRCLNTALWRLRQIMEPSDELSGCYLLTGSSGDVSFNWESDHWLDVTTFEMVVKHIASKSLNTLQDVDVKTLEDALKLYTGDLLEGFYDDWVLRAREHLRQLYLKGLAILMAYYKQHGKIEQSLNYAQALLDYDPIREEIHREVMRLYWENGQRALAIRQFETCRQILQTELGIAPMEETQNLHTQIIQNDGPSKSAPSYNQPANFQQAYQQLQSAMHAFDEAYTRVRQALHHLDTLKGPEDSKNPPFQ